MEPVISTISHEEGVYLIICVSCLTLYRPLLICYHDILNAYCVPGMVLAADGFEITFKDVTFTSTYK